MHEHRAVAPVECSFSSTSSVISGGASIGTESKVVVNPTDWSESVCGATHNKKSASAGVIPVGLMVLH